MELEEKRLYIMISQVNYYLHYLNELHIFLFFILFYISSQSLPDGSVLVIQILHYTPLFPLHNYCAVQCSVQCSVRYSVQYSAQFIAVFSSFCSVVLSAVCCAVCSRVCHREFSRVCSSSQAMVAIGRRKHATCNETLQSSKLNCTEPLL